MNDEDDVKIESEDPEAEEQVEAKIGRLRNELVAARKDKQEYMDGWQRAKADYVNLLKRLETESKNSEFKGKVKAIENFLPTLDALERAKQHEQMPEGFAAIAKQLENAFASLGLEEIGKVGENFDPACHEALGQDPTDSSGADNTVTVVLEKGWRVGDAVVRPAMVRVAHFAA